VSVPEADDYGLDVDRILPPESPWAALRRRIGGRYPIDPFGLDPQLSDLSTPLVSALVRVEATGDEHVPHEGGAVFVANRGFGIVEPAAVAVAVRRASGRRLRVIGAPSAPFLGGFFRRLGAISASPRDLATCVRAGHLVAVPLAPTWLRTGAGTPPLPLVQAMTRAPAIPVAVTPGGPLGLAIRPWRVRFGAPVALDQPHDPGDPLAAARLAEAVQAAVRQLLLLT
jgi:1-acyl-sn-glycerol-3-phosphate acyltransferase